MVPCGRACASAALRATVQKHIASAQWPQSRVPNTGRVHPLSRAIDNMSSRNHVDWDKIARKEAGEDAKQSHASIKTTRREAAAIAARGRPTVDEMFADVAALLHPKGDDKA